MYDTHVHSTFSHDGKSQIKDYTAVIAEGKLKGIGFTEHVDFMPECGGYGSFDYNSFRAGVDELRQKGFECFAGAEIDYAERVEKEIIAYVAEKPFDYTICSVHMIKGISISDGKKNELFEDSSIIRNMLELYYYEVEASLKSPVFDVIGHMGIFRRYLGEDMLGYKEIRSWVDEVESGLAKSCVLSEKIIEVNSSGLFSPSKSPFPHFAFLKAYFGYGGRTISIGSDAHSTANAGRGFDETRSILRDIGYKYIVLPWDREKFLDI